MNSLILRRTDPDTGIIEYCVTGGFFWSQDINNAKEYSSKRGIKALVTYDKYDHENKLKYHKNNQFGYGSMYIPAKYIYEIVPVTKTITEDNANAIKL